jgi:Cd2+/Zn2+-exporting ATPase
MERRAPVQRTVDRFSAIYTPVVVISALLVAALPPLLWGAPFWGDQGWLYRALALLVVACPCALVLSTPVSLVSAISRMTRSGILVKGGAVLQNLAHITTIAFDKTGTLTHGAPMVLQAQSHDCVTSANEQCAPCNEMVAIAYAVERRSEHPLARAVQSYALLTGVADRYPAALNVMALPGRGVRGEVNGRPVMVGSHAWFEQSIPHPPQLCATLDEAARNGATPLLVSVDNAYAGYMLVADAVRTESAQAVRALRDMGIDELVMVTGDNTGAARQIANAAGFTRVMADVLPAQKVEVVQTLRQEAPARVVAMVGDGVNDAPALAAADIGIAMGGGSAQAMDTADVVLLGEDLRLLPSAIQLARRTMRTIHTNIWLSVLAKLAVFVLVLIGLGSMWLAVVADVGLSLVVTLNGMHLLRVKRPHTG